MHALSLVAISSDRERSMLKGSRQKAAVMMALVQGVVWLSFQLQWMIGYVCDELDWLSHTLG